MLDIKALSTKQFFKVLNRIDCLLSEHLNLDSLENSYISSSTSISINLELVDVYLAHIYDKSIKSLLIEGFIKEVYNPLCLSHNVPQVDVNEFLDIVLTKSRDFGVNDSTYYFGRSKLAEIGD